MSGSESKPAGDGPIDEFETSILTVLSKAFPNTQQLLPATGSLGDFDSLIPQPPGAQLGTMTADEVRRWRFQTLVDSIKKLSQFGFVRSEGAAGHLYVEITAAGLRWLGQRRPQITWDEQDNLNRTFMDQLATMAEVRQSIQAVGEENKILRGQQEDLGRRLDAGRAELERRATVFNEDMRAQQGDLRKRLDDGQNTLEQRIGTFEETIDRVEHSFYSQIFIFLTVFVAAFALILTGSQVVIRSPSTDPVLLAEQTIAILGPLTLLLIVLVVVAWRVCRPH